MSLPSKRSALALACGLAFVTADVAGAADLQAQWREYARQRIAPGYSWSGIAPARAPDALSAFRARLAAHAGSGEGMQQDLLGALRLRLHADVQRQSTGAPSALGLLGETRSPITSQFAASSVDRAVGTSGQFTVSAILARQRFASAGFGQMDWEAPERLDAAIAGLPREASDGGGVRMAYTDGLTPRLSFSIALQSKLDMEPFKSYRGVYSDPGDFDVPARAELGLGFALTERLQLSAGVERVFYSDVDAFTSAALPSRFLSLLGDGTSPEFAWQDLTVYALGASFRDHGGGEWSLRYTTRQQPAPTSRLLLRALEPEFTDLNLSAGYRRALGARSELRVAASYAPSHYFLGATPYVQRDFEGGSQVEFEALWSVRF